MNDFSVDCNHSISHYQTVKQPSVSLTRAKIRKALRQEPGSFAGIARQLGISKATVSGVLRGMSTSARVMEAATAKALEILAKQEAA